MNSQVKGAKLLAFLFRPEPSGRIGANVRALTPMRVLPRRGKATFLAVNQCKC